MVHIPTISPYPGAQYVTEISGCEADHARMARLARVVMEGAPHHVTQTGNRRHAVFFSDDDYRTYKGLLVEGCAAAGVVTREYVWIDDMPVALLTFSGATQTTTFIHTGQIDEPLAITSTSRTLKWNGYEDPYGAATTFATPTTTIDMRLPGQSFQLETGSLHQNRYRDYDPSLGRYVESDPVGIAAGQNVYAYVDGDPLNNWDYIGLGPAGAEIGGEIGAWLGGFAGIETGPGDIAIVPVAGAIGSAIGSAVEDALKSGSEAGSGTKAECPVPDKCAQEWEEARDFCRQELAKPNPSRGLTGGYTDIERCARGHVSEECGGNKLNYTIRGGSSYVRRRRGS